MRFDCRPLLLLVLLACAAPAFAQKAPRERSCRILFLMAPSGAPEKLHLVIGESSREVVLPRMNFSPPYVLPAGDLTLRLLPSPPADPAQVPKGAPTFRIPESITDSYLLVNADPANKIAPVSVQVVDADVEKFRTGELLWFNLTENAVAGQVGSRKLAIKPRSRLILEAPTTGKESYPINLSYRLANDDRLYPLCETSWIHDPRSRKVAFIFAEKDRRAPRVLAFTDYRPPRAKP